MRNKSPAFQFYPQDWLASPRVAMMSLEEEGAYIRLLCYDWTNDGIPESDKDIAILSRFNGSLTNLKSCFNQHPTKVGFLTNSRLQDEREKQQKWRKKCSDAGKKSAASRSKKGTKKVSSTTVGRLVQLKGNTSSSIVSSKEDTYCGGVSDETPTVGLGVSSKKEKDPKVQKVIDRLFEILTKNRVVRVAPSIKAWQQPIRLLLEVDKQPLEDVLTVLDWYEKNHKWRYCPVIKSGKSLRNKFDNLWQAMERKSETEPAPAEAVEISPEVETILDQLKKLNWKDNTLPNLPKAVQVSFQNYRKFYLNCWDLKRKCEKMIKKKTAENDGVTRTKWKCWMLDDFLKHLISVLQQPDQFVLGWFTQVHSDVEDWSEFSGNLARYTLTVEGDRFQSMGRDICQSYSHQTKEWEFLMTKIK